jgi:hypothetical protein
MYPTNLRQRVTSELYKSEQTVFNQKGSMCVVCVDHLILPYQRFTILINPIHLACLKFYFDNHN